MFDGSSKRLSVSKSSSLLLIFFSLYITKHKHANTLNCAENAFVEATPISGPAAIEIEK